MPTLRLDQVSTLIPSAVGGRRGRLVVQDLFDPLVKLGIDLGQHVESLDILVNLLGLGSSKLGLSALFFVLGKGPEKTHDTGRDVLVRDSPSKSQVAHVSTELFGDLGQFPDLLELGFTLVASQELGLVGRSALNVDGESRSLGQTIVVFASKNTLLERGPDGAFRQHGQRDPSVKNPYDPYPSHRQRGSYSVSKLSRCNIE